MLVIGFLYHRKIKSTSNQPQLNTDLNQRFKQANIILKPTSKKYSLAVFLGEQLSNKQKIVLNELNYLSNEILQIYLIRRHILSWSIDNQNNKSDNYTLILDQNGAKHQGFGISASDAALVFFETNTNKNLGFYDNIKTIEDFQKAIFKLSLNRLLCTEIKLLSDQSAPTFSSDAQKLFNFPFDSLIENAKEININLDTVPVENLKFIQTIGSAEEPLTGELFFSKPHSLTLDAQNNIYVADNQDNQIIVLSKEGAFFKRLGRKGRGPGEFFGLSSICWDSNHLIVADAFRIQKFDQNGTFLKSYSIDQQLSLWGNFAIIKNIVFIPSSPNPPFKTNLINAYELSSEHAPTIASFFRYLEPEKSYSNQRAAITSQNMVCIATDGTRYISFSLRHQQHIFLIDLIQRTSKKIMFTGKCIQKFLDKKIDSAIPDFAVKWTIKNLTFDQNHHLYLYMINQIIKFEIISINSLTIDNMINYQFNSNNFKLDDFHLVQIKNKNYIFLSYCLPYILHCKN